MNRYSSLILVLGVVLAGCSDLATKDAPIEDRAGAKVATAGGAGGAAGGGAAGATGTEAGGATAGGGADAGVRTHGTDAQGVQGRAISGTTLGGTAASGGPAAYATMRVPPKDPASPLAKRVIYFEYDSAAIKPEFQPVIQAHAEFLRASREAKSILQGHADERGSRDYNLALGQRRAESILQALSLLGVDAAKLEAVSLGEEKPAKDGHDEAAWTMNRRVEIYYQGE
jgi:peptidoglycan-associated lipoprotein